MEETPPTYKDVERLFTTLTLSDLHYLQDSLANIIYERQNRFCKFVFCSKEEAKKALFGFKTCGEMGGEYGFFVGSTYDDSAKAFVTRELTTDEKDQIENARECCYYHGSECQLDEEDCECKLGANDYTLVLKSMDSDSDDD